MGRNTFLPIGDIEDASLCLLAEYGALYGVVEQPPVPVEEILEAHLGLALDFDDLVQRIGLPDVLGATWIQDRQVCVDLSLDPTENPAKEGRYRFTLAHEVGHWTLHRQYFMADSAQARLFDDATSPSIVCRKSSRKDPMEWQADMFAGLLLMPKTMVVEAWTSLNGSREPYVAEQEIADLSAKWRLGDDDLPTVDVARDLAREFNVSGQAMQIRLIGLGLIRTKDLGPDLLVK